MLLVYFAVVLHYFCAQSHQLDRSNRNTIYDIIDFIALYMTINIITKNLSLLTHLYERRRLAIYEMNDFIAEYE